MTAGRAGRRRLEAVGQVFDIPKQGEHSHDGFLIRRVSIETGVSCLTSIDTANALLTALEDANKNDLTLVDIATIDNY